VGLSYKKAVFVIKRTRYQQFIPGRVSPTSFYADAGHSHSSVNL